MLWNLQNLLGLSIAKPFIFQNINQTIKPINNQPVIELSNWSLEYDGVKTAAEIFAIMWHYPMQRNPIIISKVKKDANAIKATNIGFRPRPKLE